MTGATLDLQALLADAWAHHQSRRHPEALRRAQDVLRLQQDDPLAHIIAGESLRHLGRRTEASAHLARAIALAPGWALAHVAQAAACREWGQHGQAERHALKAVEVQPGESVGWCELGLLYQQQGDHTNARQCAAHARQLEPESALASSLLEVPPLDAAAADLAGQPNEPRFRDNLYAALCRRFLHYHVATLPCRVSRWLSMALRGPIGLLAAGYLSVATIVILSYQLPDVVRLPWLGFVAWLIAVCWPSLTLFERLTMHGVVSPTRTPQAQARPPGMSPGRLVGHLAWLVLALGVGGMLIAIGLRDLLVETFLEAFVTNVLILMGMSSLLLLLLESVRSRRRGDRLKRLQAAR